MVHLLERLEALGTVMGAVKSEGGHGDGAFSQFGLSIFEAGVSQRRVDGVAVVIESGLHYSRLSESLFTDSSNSGGMSQLGDAFFHQSTINWKSSWGRVASAEGSWK